jgi:anaerobic selenocysteine-containing dehydrogenase
VWKLDETLPRLPFIVSFGSFLDETSILSDLILPDHSFLESFVDAAPESGSMVAVLGVAPPVMKPLHDTRATPDVLLEVSRQLGEAARAPVADLRGDADRDDDEVPGLVAGRRCVDRGAGEGRMVGDADDGRRGAADADCPVAQLVGLGRAEV